tara:strand:+ start:2738 stop:3022 length:285 start_codon:yes stop_codon:yes gene_type:complete
MMSEESVIIYSKPNCPSCIKAKAQFEKMKVPYTTKNIGTDIQPQELFGIFEQKGLPQPRTAPQIFIGDTYIGGYEALVKYIEDTGFNGTGYSVG